MTHLHPLTLHVLKLASVEGKAGTWTYQGDIVVPMPVGQGAVPCLSSDSCPLCSGCHTCKLSSVSEYLIFSLQKYSLCCCLRTAGLCAVTARTVIHCIGMYKSARILVLTNRLQCPFCV